MKQNAKVCESCGRPIQTLEELEAELGEPILYLLKQYERWKQLKKPGEKRDENHADIEKRVSISRNDY